MWQSPKTPVPRNVDAGRQDASAGPANESGQHVAISVVSTDHPEFFKTAPTIDVNGKLTFELAKDAAGVASVVMHSHR